MNLKDLTILERRDLIIRLIGEQVVDQRKKLHYWRDLNKQAAQIDTGYIAQHLVSLVTGIHGSSMRGKGDDLDDGSEVKAANFLDSLDKRGAIAPRWNFSSNNLITMKSFLKVPSIYLVSVDLNQQDLFRARIWKLDPRKHTVFNKRYKEWMIKLGIPKLNDPKRPGVNFQLFPPRSKTDENFARHGNGKENGFLPIKIKLENIKGSTKILHVEDTGEKIEILGLYGN